MINNSEEIRKMLSFEKDDFYFVQILKRRKDNPEMEKDMIVIDNFYVSSFDSYDKLVPQFIKLCDMENARTYFRVNKRNYKALAPHMVKRTVEIAFGNDCHALRNVFDSVAGEFHSDPDKKWIVDIDWIDTIRPDRMDGKYVYGKVIHDVMALQFETKREPLMIKLPTKNGEHLITRPFNLQKFKMSYPDIDCHKDNPTLLYCP
jgi:hypothetical protein